MATDFPSPRNHEQLLRPLDPALAASEAIYQAEIAQRAAATALRAANMVFYSIRNRLAFPREGFLLQATGVSQDQIRVFSPGYTDRVGLLPDENPDDKAFFNIAELSRIASSLKRSGLVAPEETDDTFIVKGNLLALEAPLAPNIIVLETTIPRPMRMQMPGESSRSRSFSKLETHIDTSLETVRLSEVPA